MSYEPRGKVKALIDAMRAAASERPVWTSTDVAKVLETSTNAVPAFVDPSIRHGVIFRKLENGRSQYSLKPFPPSATVAPGAPRETTATGWKPPQMACTRPGAGTPAPGARRHDTVDGLAPGAPRIYPDEPREDAFAKMAAARQERRETAGDTENGRPAEKVQERQEPQPALTIELDEPLDDQRQEEDAEPLTWAHWDDGDLDLFGLVELENGGYRIQAKDVARLRRMLAWLPA
jgi:hypothetical protein